MSSIRVALAFNLKPESKEDFFQRYSCSLKEDEFDSEDQFAEWDTVNVIEAIKKSIEKKYECVLIEADNYFVDKIRKYKPNIVFNIAEGLNGGSREAQVPAILDMLNIPYVGSGVWTLSTCLDKFRTKQILQWYKIATPSFCLVDNLDELSKLNGKLIFPSIIKPIFEGSSKGIYNDSIVYDFESLYNKLSIRLKQYKQPFLIEEYLDGREFTVGILGNYPDEEILPIVEINYRALPSELNRIYSYEAKWIVDRPENPLDIFDCPASISPELESKIKEVALIAYRSLNCKDWARIDIRLDKNDVPNVLEVNPLPGILPNPEDNSCLPKAARAAGYSYEELILKTLENGMKRAKIL